VAKGLWAKPVEAENKQARSKGKRVIEGPPVRE